MKGFYFCYDERISRELERKKIEKITVALHPKTGRKFWLYQQTPEFSATLRQIIANTR